MNEISNTQLITAVNQVLMSANLPTTNEVVQYVIQSIMPFLNQMTVQMNQTQASFQCILQSLVNQNRQQIIEIAKLKQIREEMPRMFCESPVNGTAETLLSLFYRKSSPQCSESSS